ncbi:MAG: hypothetical protein IJ215_00840 [Clostridia bacterium]|nr:hypothetical protein [Clostridia bacterium]
MMYMPKCITCEYFNKKIKYPNVCKHYEKIPDDIYNNKKECNKYREQK